MPGQIDGVAEQDLSARKCEKPGSLPMFLNITLLAPGL